MDIIMVNQGSQEWKQLRKDYKTASEAPIALGVSKYVTRSELLKRKHSGIEEEIDSRKQALFDAGHQAEIPGRSMAEAIIGTELYPITVKSNVDGLALLASLDGCTMDEEIIFEHKLWSESLAAEVRAESLSPHYTVQMDQQLLVSGAKRCLFMVSDGTEENMVWCWYEPNQEKFKALIAGWKQFHADLAEYVPVEIVEKPKAEPIMQFPALAIQIRGEVTLSNLPAFREKAEEFITKISTELITDEDFANADATVKFCEKAEKDLEHAKSAAIAQTSSIDELMRTIDHIKEQLRTKRLALEKLVTKQKESIKEEAVKNGKAKMAEHVAALEKEIAPIRLIYAAPDFAGAIKGKRTVAGLNEAISTTLANAKISTNEIAALVRGNLACYNETAKDHTFLFADLQQVIYKPADDFKLTVQARIDAHKAKEAERLADEKAKAEADAIAARADAVLTAAQDTRVAESAPAQSPVSAPADLFAVTYGHQESTALVNLGTINAALGFTVTAEFLAKLGFTATVQKNARQYRESDYPAICASIARHVQQAALTPLKAAA